MVILLNQTQKRQENIYPVIGVGILMEKESEICSYEGCDKDGHLSQRLGSSMFCYRLIVCDEHEKELPN